MCVLSNVYSTANRLDPALQAENYSAAREARRETEDKRLRLENSISEAERRLAELDERLAVLSKRRTSLGRTPVSLGFAFLALIELLIGGIVVPLYFLGTGTEAGDRWGKWLVVGLFISGLIGVFAYLWYLLQWSTRNLRLGSSAQVSDEETKTSTPLA